jgi:hypothetical protein
VYSGVPLAVTLNENGCPSRTIWFTGGVLAVTAVTSVPCNLTSTDCTAPVVPVAKSLTTTFHVPVDPSPQCLTLENVHAE